MHPLIYTQIETELQRLKTPYCIISVPLLIETKKTNFVDRVLVVDCSIAMQIARVKYRDKLEDVQIRTIIAHQTSRENRLAKANDIIENSKTILQLAQQVKKLHNLYLLLSST